MTRGMYRFSSRGPFDAFIFRRPGRVMECTRLAAMRRVYRPVRLVIMKCVVNHACEGTEKERDSARREEERGRQSFPRRVIIEMLLGDARARLR